MEEKTLALAQTLARQASLASDTDSPPGSPRTARTHASILQDKVQSFRSVQSPYYWFFLFSPFLCSTFCIFRFFSPFFIFLFSPFFIFLFSPFCIFLSSYFLLSVSSYSPFCIFLSLYVFISCSIFLLPST
jgi:hypothetical protein